MGDELAAFAVVSVADGGLMTAADLEDASHTGAADTIQMISVEGIDPSSLINHVTDLTTTSTTTTTTTQTTHTTENALDATGISVLNEPEPTPMVEVPTSVADIIAAADITPEERQELEALQVGGMEFDTQQLVTIDGKQLFLLTADGTLAAVTADVLQKGAITLSDSITVAPSAEEEDGEEPTAKRVKLEEPDQEQEEAEHEVTAAAAAATATFNLQHGLVYLATPDVRDKDDVQKAQQAVPPKVVSTPRVLPSHVVHRGSGRDGSETDVTQAWFTTKDDKQSLQGQGHLWKQGQWSKDEVEILQNNISQYCTEHSINDPTEVIFEMSKDERKDFYRTVARGLNRPLFSVYRRVIRMYDQKNHIGKYSSEEIAKLRELRGRHGNDWAKIGAALGRSASSVKDKCRLMRDMCNSGKWLPEEEQRLADAVYSLSGVKPGENVTTGLSWASVSERVVTRSEKQCRTKWLNYLNWKQQGGSEWTRMDDLMLIEKIDATGASDETQIDWTEIAENWSSVRSPQWLRGKWWTMKRHVPDYNMMAFPELVKCVQTLHTQNLRTAVPLPSTKPRNRTEGRSDAIHLMPVLNSVGDATSMMTAAATAAADEESGLISYEVLQGLQGSQQQQGALLITQPNNNPAISLPNGNFTSDHIIVHTLPLGEVAGVDGVVQLNPESQLVIDPASCTIGESDDKTALSHINLSASTPTTVQSSIDDIDMEQHLAASSVICSGGVTVEEVINLNTDDFHIHNPHVDDVNHSAVDAASAMAAADMVMVSTGSPQTFARPSSHNVILSDPMLPSDRDVDLMGCSDIETEKIPAVDTS